MTQIKKMKKEIKEKDGAYYLTCENCGEGLELKPLGFPYSYTTENYLNDEKILTIGEIVAISSDCHNFLVTCTNCAYCRNVKDNYEMSFFVEKIKGDSDA